MIVYLAIIALQIFCVVDVIRRGRNTIWIMALIFLPVVGALAYFIVEILPTLQHNRHVRAARQTVVEKLDPERELRAAQQALDVADTMANRLRVADALTELGRHPAALPLYQRGAGPRPDFRTGEKLARSLFLNDRPDEALSVLDALPNVTAQSDQDRAKLLRGRILEDMGRSDEALALYGDVMDRMAGDEARCRYAALLLKVGRRGDARRVLEEVEHRMKYIDRHTRASQGPMYDWAMNELTTLRT
ncbi:MAG TPA: PLDc N-terminal domain-containing protein [Sphingomicrobium sp.]|nr:PLDc N-terminal domain-containing protein [Sphingomicrobium sp.]